MPKHDFKFSGAYGGGNGKKKEMPKGPKLKDFTESNKRSEERNKKLSKWEQDAIREARKRTQARYRKSKMEEWKKKNKKQ